MDSLCPTKRGRMVGVKAKNGVLELWSKGVMGGHGVEESWSDGLATDGTRTCTDSEKTMNREPRELPRRGWKTGGDGQRWVERRFNLGKGGRLVGKWACFAHLFPHDSMQVVDFPLLCRLSVFWLRVEGGESA